jgi:hypothetical protein
MKANWLHVLPVETPTRHHLLLTSPFLICVKLYSPHRPRSPCNSCSWVRDPMRYMHSCFGFDTRCGTCTPVLGSRPDVIHAPLFWGSRPDGVHAPRFGFETRCGTCTPVLGFETRWGTCTPVLGSRPNEVHAPLFAICLILLAALGVQIGSGSHPAS